MWADGNMGVKSADCWPLKTEGCMYCRVCKSVLSVETEMRQSHCVLCVGRELARN